MTSFDVSMSGKNLSLNFAVDRFANPGGRPDARPAEPPPPSKPDPEPARFRPAQLVPAKSPLRGACTPPRPALTRHTVVLALQAAAAFDLVAWFVLGGMRGLQLLVFRLVVVALCSCVCLDRLLNFHACLVALAASLHFEVPWRHSGGATGATAERLSLATLAAVGVVTAHRGALTLALAAPGGSMLAALLLALAVACLASTLLLGAWAPDVAGVADTAYVATACIIYYLLARMQRLP